MADDHDDNHEDIDGSKLPPASGSLQKRSEGASLGDPEPEPELTAEEQIGLRLIDVIRESEMTALLNPANMVKALKSADIL